MPGRMISVTRARDAVVIASLALALATPAVAAAAPAGDEYVPSVPKAAGKELVANPKQGSGASVLEPQVRGAETASGGSSGKPDKKNDSGTKRKTVKQIVAHTGQDSGSGGDSGGTIFNPVILLVIAGVIAAGAGMIIRRRHGDSGDAGGAPRPAPPPSARPTPDGEIVAGGDKPA